MPPANPRFGAEHRAGLYPILRMAMQTFKFRFFESGRSCISNKLKLSNFACDRFKTTNSLLIRICMPNRSLNALLISLGLLISQSLVSAIDDPESEFLRAYMHAQRAEQLESEGRLGEALSRYRAAVEILQRITRENPDWQAIIVEYRTRRTLRSIERLQGQVQEVVISPELPPVDQQLTPAAQTGAVQSPANRQEALVVNLERRLAEVQRRLETSEKNQLTLKTELDAVRTERNHLKKQLKEAEKRSADLTSELEASRKNETNLKDEIENTKKRDKLDNEKIATLEKQLAEVAADRDRITKALLSLPGEENDPLAKLANLQKQLENSQKRNRDFEVKLNNLLRQDGTPDTAALGVEISRLTEEVVRLQEEAENYKKTIRSLEEKVESTSAEMNKMRVAGGDSADAERLRNENALLKEILRSQLKAQARRDQARKMIAEELAKIQTDSDRLTRELELLAQPLIELDENRRNQLSALLREPVLGPGEREADLTAKIAAGGPPNASGAPTGPEPSESETDPGSLNSVPEAHQDLAREARQKFDAKDYEASEKLYDALLAKAPNNTLALSNLGVIYFHTGRLKSAEMVLKKSLQISPDDAFAHQTLGIVHFRQGRYDEAMAALTRAIDLDPKNATAHNYLGITVSKKGWPEAAEKELLEAISLNPNYAEAHFNLAIIYAMNTPPSVELARRHYQKALSLGAAPDKGLEKFLSQ